MAGGHRRATVCQAGEHPTRKGECYCARRVPASSAIPPFIEQCRRLGLKYISPSEKHAMKQGGSTMSDIAIPELAELDEFPELSGSGLGFFKELVTTDSLKTVGKYAAGGLVGKLVSNFTINTVDKVQALAPYAKWAKPVALGLVSAVLGRYADRKPEFREVLLGASVVTGAHALEQALDNLGVLPDILAQGPQLGQAEIEPGGVAIEERQLPAPQMEGLQVEEATPRLSAVEVNPLNPGDELYGFYGQEEDVVISAV